jgi:hypothetical protein
MATAQAEDERAMLDKLWLQRIERTRYAADRPVASASSPKRKPSPRRPAAANRLGSREGSGGSHREPPAGRPLKATPGHSQEPGPGTSPNSSKIGTTERVRNHSSRLARPDTAEVPGSAWRFRGGRHPRSQEWLGRIVMGARFARTDVVPVMDALAVVDLTI